MNLYNVSLPLQLEKIFLVGIHQLFPQTMVGQYWDLDMLLIVSYRIIMNYDVTEYNDSGFSD